VFLLFAGNTVSEMGHTVFQGAPFLDSSEHGGFIYIRPSFQCLQKLILPPSPYLVALLVHRYLRSTNLKKNDVWFTWSNFDSWWSIVVSLQASKRMHLNLHLVNACKILVGRIHFRILYVPYSWVYSVVSLVAIIWLIIYIVGA
jgi:hypothetical protein